jgi:uncharacterized membrane protein YqaE (UPF0057 family)
MKLLSIMLPPLAVYRIDGGGFHLVLSFLLTLLGYLPGVIHALIRSRD